MIAEPLLPECHVFCKIECGPNSELARVTLGEGDGTTDATLLPSVMEAVQDCGRRDPRVRAHLRVPQWDEPAGNLLCIYFDACERRGVHANSGVARQLMKRVRATQPTPSHLFVGKSNDEKIQLVLRHFDPSESGSVSVKNLLMICRTINPRRTEEDWKDLVAVLRAPKDTQVSYKECSDVLLRNVKDMNAAATQQALLECLACDVVLKDCDRTAKFKVAFRFLDADASGELDIEELKRLTCKFDHVSEFSQAKQLLAAMDSNHDATVSWPEYFDYMSELTRDLSDHEIDCGIDRLRHDCRNLPWRYDFSRCGVGQHAVLALLDTLRYDRGFGGLDLSRCGVNNGGCRALADLLRDHPVAEAVWLRDNAISDGGAEELRQLLDSNARITCCDVSGCHVLRDHSRTHARAGASCCERAHPLLQAVHRNKAAKRPARHDVVSMLQQQAQHIKEAFAELSHGNDEAPLDDIIDAVCSTAHQWDLSDEDVRAVIAPPRVLSGHGGSVDATGKVCVSFAEFMSMLRSDGVVKRCCAAIKRHLVTVKTLFLSIADAEQRVSVSLLKHCLSVHVLDARNGWDVSADEIECTIGNHIMAAGPYMSQESCDGQTISWTEFIHTALFLLNN